MELVHGILRELGMTAELGGNSGGGSGGAVYTTHVATFQLDAQPVRMSGHAPPMVRNGDEVLVAGSVSAEGVLVAHGYRNLTRGVRSADYHPIARWLLLGVCIASPLVLATKVLDPNHVGVDAIEVGISMAVSLFGVVAYAHAQRVSRAWTMLDRWPCEDVTSTETSTLEESMK